MTDSAAAPDDTGVESGWFRLFRTLDYASGRFWLGVIAAQQSLWAQELARRTADTTRSRGHRCRTLLAASPDDLVAFATTVGVEKTDELLWVGTAITASGTSKEWEAAWRALFAGLNRRREELGRNLCEGLVVAGPFDSPRWWREAAADLWSKRAVLIELAGPERDDGYSPDIQLLEPDAASEPDWRGWLTAANAADGDPTHPGSSAFDEGFAERIRDLEQVIQQGGSDAGRVIDDAIRLYEELRSEPGARFAIAAFVTAQAYSAHDGNTRAARQKLTAALDAGLAPRRRLVDACRLAIALGKTHHDHLGVALAAARLLVELATVGPGEPTEAQLSARRYELIELVDLLRSSGRVLDAARFAAEALGVDRERVERFGRTPDNLHGLSVSLQRVGDVARVSGDVSGARAAFDEKLGVDRERVERFGRMPDNLHGLSVSLERVGDVARVSGDVSGARAAFDEALGVDRERVERFGRMPDNLHGLSAGLERVGDVARVSGDVSGARAAFDEALGVDRERVERFGRMPDNLHGLSAGLERVGDVARVSGDVSGARAAFDEKLGVDRERVERFGRTPDNLHGLSVSLQRVGDVALVSGDVSGARAAFDEALGVDRERVERFGRMPDNLLGLSVSLERVGDVARVSGDVSGARAAFDEKLGVDRERVERFGRTPDNLHGLSVSLQRVGDVARVSGDVSGARAAFDEALGVDRERVERFGRMPDNLLGLSVSLGRVALVASSEDREDDATAAWQEATAAAREAFAVTGYADASIVQLLNWCLDECASAVERQAGAEAASQLRAERRELDAGHDQWLSDRGWP